jgi:hypothetical protein
MVKAKKARYILLLTIIINAIYFLLTPIGFSVKLAIASIIVSVTVVNVLEWMGLKVIALLKSE